MSNLEKDYSIAVAAINAKLAEAGKLVEEAGKIGRDAGIEVLNIHPYLAENGEYTDDQLEELEDILYKVEFGPLLGAMDEVGWATSSLNC